MANTFKDQLTSCGIGVEVIDFLMAKGVTSQPHFAKWVKTENKIAEKIITICQGDLNMSPSLLNALVDSYSASKPPLPLDNANNQAHASMKNLWNSIKQKVFPNYSTKGYRLLIEWIQLKMSHLVTSPKTLAQDILNTKPVN